MTRATALQSLQLLFARSENYTAAMSAIDEHSGQ